MINPFSETYKGLHASMVTVLNFMYLANSKTEVSTISLGLPHTVNLMVVVESSNKYEL